MKDNDVKGGRRVVWSPQERQAEFMQRGEYEALYGGAAGGGKSDALLAEALRQADKACYRGIIFRKTYYLYCGKTVYITLGICLVVLAVIGIFAAINFDKAFTIFHEIFFNGKQTICHSERSEESPH